MPRYEPQKYLDLDLVVQQIPNAEDRSLFQEAVNCYYADSHRAAAILAWYAVANCLKRRIFHLVEEGDGEAQQAAQKLTHPDKGDSTVGEEKALIEAARKCELVDEFEAKSLDFLRELRNKCAHPTGYIPPAEAIRHALHISSQLVLCRVGYRGMSYIRNIVTIQFDDGNFLANDLRVAKDCKEIRDQVAERLWPQFVKQAVAERGKSHSDTWRQAAYKFLRELIHAVEDQLVEAVAAPMAGFYEHDPDFFATLVGLDERTARYWGSQKRAQVRGRIRQSSAVRIRPEDVRAWAMICAMDGLEPKDTEFLREKFHLLARHLTQEKLFLNDRRREVVELIGVMLSDDAFSSTAASGCIHLFPTALFAHPQNADEVTGNALDAAVLVIVRQVIARFMRDEKHRQLMERVKQWHPILQVALLESAAEFWSECSEDNPGDVALLFDARDELKASGILSIPTEFYEAMRRINAGQIQAEWSQAESEAGQIFRARLTNADRDLLNIGVEITAPAAGDVDVAEEWHERLGVQITERQATLVKYAKAEHGRTPDELAVALSIGKSDVEQDLDRLVLQGILIRIDDRYVVSEHLRGIVLDEPDNAEDMRA